MTREELVTELRALADKFSEGWNDGIRIDASDLMLLSEAASALEAAPATEREACAAIVEADKVREPKTPYQMQYNRGITAVAEKIRARGNHV